MTREEVESIIEEFGWVNTNKEMPHDSNKSVYIRWINSADIDVYIGNYFIEVETQPHAFPYKDTRSTRQEIIDFLLG